MLDDFDRSMAGDVKGGLVTATAMELGFAPGQFTPLPALAAK